MDRYRISPARPVCLSAAGAAEVQLRPAAPPSGRRSSGAEIGIFTAERYFSAADVGRRDAAMIPAAPAPALHDHEHELPPRLPVPAVADVASQSGRTVASSEASWNSRSGLLSAGHLAAARQQQQTGSIGAGAGATAVYGSDQGYRGSRTGGGSGQRWTLFGRDCPCAGRKAVTVDVASEPRRPAATAHFHAKFSPQCAVEECLESAIFKVKHPSPPRTATTEEEPTKVKVTVTPGSRAFPLAADVPFTALSNPDIDRRVLRSGGFTFPALGAARVVSGGGGGILDEPPRVSLEVFRPIDEDSVMLADPPPADVPLAGRVALLPRAPPAVAALVVDEEAMSDASSDLFDLESFVESSSYPTTYRGRGSRRNSADDDLPYVSTAAAAAAAEPALSECMYPASEASVVWSVATAEGGAFDAASVANFSSAASACCVDDLRYVVPESPEAGFTAAMSRSARRKKSGGFLSSCRCEKAVSVGPTPVRVVRPPAHPGAAAKRSGGGAPRYHHHGRAHVPVRT
ncbi:protein PHYTOCHROME KINASE SUBSTRATE 4-like [Miscanthus floridulus]|uniref:protein PHYTOCHROME KINASE SUBSTRATE 4-like n=1 Tax=Miscanthus floridulus TaxID=154761 RepID=UPI00345947C5